MDDLFLFFFLLTNINFGIKFLLRLSRVFPPSTLASIQGELNRKNKENLLNKLVHLNGAALFETLGNRRFSNYDFIDTRKVLCYI